MTRMKAYYKETVAPALFKKFGYKSTMQVPKLDKIMSAAVKQRKTLR